MDSPLKNLSTQIAITILNGFDRHFKIFSDITKGAKQRFENADWNGEREASRERIKFYDTRVKDAIRYLQKTYELEPFDSQLWFDVKLEYVLLISNHLQPELAETFYNSVFCALFHRDYFGNDYIFVRSAVSTDGLTWLKEAGARLTAADFGTGNFGHPHVVEIHVHLELDLAAMARPVVRLFHGRSDSLSPTSDASPSSNQNNQNSASIKSMDAAPRRRLEAAPASHSPAHRKKTHALPSAPTTRSG